MRWQLLLSLSLVTAFGLVGCARQSASKLNMDLEKNGPVSQVDYDPSKEKDKSYGVRAATGKSGIRGALDSGSYYGTDSLLLQLINYLQPYSSIVSNVIGVTLGSDSFNNIYAQYCAVNPYYCYGRPESQQVPVRVSFTLTTAGGTAPKLYRVYVSQNQYSGLNAGNFQGTSYAERWTTTGTSTEFTGIIFPGSNLSFYQASSVGATNLTASMTVTPLSGSSTTPGSGSKDITSLLNQSTGLPSYYVSQVNVDSLTVTPIGSTGTTAKIKVGLITPQQVCYSWYCLNQYQ